MKKHRATAAAVVLTVAATAASAAEQKKTRDEMVHDDRKEVQSDDTWIYNDLARAKEAAAAAGKPMMVVFRCIP